MSDKVTRIPDEHAIELANQIAAYLGSRKNRFCVVVGSFHLQESSVHAAQLSVGVPDSAVQRCVFNAQIAANTGVFTSELHDELLTNARQTLEQLGISWDIVQILGGGVPISLSVEKDILGAAAVSIIGVPNPAMEQAALLVALSDNSTYVPCPMIDGEEMKEAFQKVFKILNLIHFFSPKTK